MVESLALLWELFKNPESLTIILKHWQTVILLLMCGAVYKLVSHIMKENKKQREVIATASAKTILSNQQYVEIVRYTVWYASLEKLSYIRIVLDNPRMDIDTTQWKKAIRENITTFLIRRSSEYIEELNQYLVCKWVIGLWDWVANNFPMDIFLDDIFKTILSENILLIDKIEQVKTKMMKYQDLTWKELNIYLNKNN